VLFLDSVDINFFMVRMNLDSEKDKATSVFLYNMQVIRRSGLDRISLILFIILCSNQCLHVGHFMQWDPPRFSLGLLPPVILESLQFSLRNLSPIPPEIFSLSLWTLSAAGLVGNIQFLIGMFRYPQYEAFVLPGTHNLLVCRVLNNFQLWH